NIRELDVKVALVEGDRLIRADRRLQEVEIVEQLPQLLQRDCLSGRRIDRHGEAEPIADPTLAVAALQDIQSTSYASQPIQDDASVGIRQFEVKGADSGKWRRFVIGARPERTGPNHSDADRRKCTDGDRFRCKSLLDVLRRALPPIAGGFTLQV